LHERRVREVDVELDRRNIASKRAGRGARGIDQIGVGTAGVPGAGRYIRRFVALEKSAENPLGLAPILKIPSGA